MRDEEWERWKQGYRQGYHAGHLDKTWLGLDLVTARHGSEVIPGYGEGYADAQAGLPQAW